MQIDAFTVLVFGFCIKMILGALFVVFWFDDRRAPWFGWWGAAFFSGAGCALLFMLRGGAPDFLTIGFGNALLLMAFACAWQGVRLFEGRRPLWWPVIALPVLWIAICLVPAFMDNAHLRVVVSSLMISPLLAMSAVEFGRGRAEMLRSRWPLIVLFLMFSTFFLIRIPLVNVLPFPFGALAAEPGWLGAFNLIMFSHVIIITVLLVAMNKERLELDQRMKAQTDALTGVLNRRAFDHRGVRLVQRHEHDGAPLCLAVLDIDRFKALNDRHGHRGGDDVLVRVAALIHECLRPTDLLFRIGGEEFCCLIPSTGIDEAQWIAERVRAAIEAEVFALKDGEVGVTASIGIASTEHCGYEVDVLMHHADEALYRAKRQGRNRVIVAPPWQAWPRVAALQDGISRPRAAG